VDDLWEAWITQLTEEQNFRDALLLLPKSDRSVPSHHRVVARGSYL
jgi:hypothetical protein